jgi:hypothetical protein
MEALIKFLKSFGLSDQEIKKVLQEVPVDQKGFAGTNITKGIFEKGGKQVSADYPLVTETMVSPFKLDKYKGLSRKETLEKADEALKYLDKELTRTSNLIINQNLQLAPEQKINFSNNLRMKREFEKELETFKTQPEAEIIQLETKQPVSKKGIEQLIENVGQVNPPGTLAGDIETRVNRLKAIADKKGMNVGEILKETGEAQLKYAAGNDVGLLRSVARQIMFNDIKSGKLKAPKEIQDIVSGASNIDVIEPFRNIYGENALEQLDSLIPDFKNVATEIDAEKLARSKYEFTPKLDRPKESYTADEMEKILKGEEPPEKKANGGAMGLDYLTGMGPEDTTREKFGLGSTIKAITKEPVAGLVIRLNRPIQPGDPVGSYYSPPGDGSGLSSIIRAVPQPSAPSITLDAKPAVVRPEDDVVNRYREYLNASKPVQSDLENRYRDLINNPMSLTPATGLPVSIPTPVIEGLSFISPQGEKIKFGGGVVGFVKPNGEPYTGPVPENMQNFSRMVAAEGGRIGFEKGSIPEEEDEEPSEEYIKSREAGRFKYSFDVQGPDSRTRKSGLPGRTNPKDYGLGITYLSNPSNETAPEIRVGGSRRGAGIEIRKRFKEGGLGYLVGE